MQVSRLLSASQLVLKHLDVVYCLDDDVELGELAGLLEVGQQLLEFLHVGLADGCVGLQFDLPDLDSHVVVVVAGAVVRAGLAGIRPGAGVITRWRGQIIWSASKQRRSARPGASQTAGSRAKD